jgi:hypothetical protein
MSASTRAIQQPMSRGSIFGAVLMAAAVLFAVVAITWGATNLVATKSVATPVQAPLLLDKGSRGELGATVPARAPGSVLDRGDRFELKQTAPLSVGGYGGPRMGSTPRLVGTTTNPDRLKDDNASVSTSSGGHGGLRAQ